MTPELKDSLREILETSRNLTDRANRLARTQPGVAAILGGAAITLSSMASGMYQAATNPDAAEKMLDAVGLTSRIPMTLAEARVRARRDLPLPEAFFIDGNGNAQFKRANGR